MKNRLILLAWGNLVLLCVLLFIMNVEHVKNKFADLLGLNPTNVQYNTPCYDEQLVGSNTLYPICHKLDVYPKASVIELFPPKSVDYYKAMLFNGSMICGKEHRSLRFLKGAKNR